MTMIGLDYIKHQENARHNRAQEKLTKEGQINDLLISRERIDSSERIASLDRASRAEIASLDRASKEQIAEADRKLKQDLGYMGNVTNVIGTGGGIISSIIRGLGTRAKAAEKDEDDKEEPPKQDQGGKTMPVFVGLPVTPEEQPAPETIPELIPGTAATTQVPVVEWTAPSLTQKVGDFLEGVLVIGGAGLAIGAAGGGGGAGMTEQAMFDGGFDILGLGV